jgi:hypothetical protein
MGIDKSYCCRPQNSVKAISSNSAEACFKRIVSMRVWKKIQKVLRGNVMLDCAGLEHGVTH